MVRLFNYLLRQRRFGSALVQLGGLEPPTSCSTDKKLGRTYAAKTGHRAAQYSPILLINSHLSAIVQDTG